jgi:hypothetical protein
MERIIRSKLGHFLNTTLGGGTNWARIGLGVESLSVSQNTETEDVHYIHEVSGRNISTSVAPTISTDQIAYNGDPIFDMVDRVRVMRLTGTAANTGYVEVLYYRSNELSNIPAFRNEVNIQVGDTGDAADAPISIGYDLGFLGDPQYGFWDDLTQTFTGIDMNDPSAVSAWENTVFI